MPRWVAARFFFDNAAVLSKFLTEWPICQDRFDKLRVVDQEGVWYN